jgi:excisionase family DNA binding protein
MNDESRLLVRVEEAARLLGLGRSKTYELLASGELPAVRIGRARRISIASLEGWVSRKVAEQADVQRMK